MLPFSVLGNAHRVNWLLEHFEMSLIKHPLGHHFDPRTTVEVEATRSTQNNKPYRSKAQKVEAQNYASKVHGTFHTKAPVRFHSEKPRAE